MDENEKFLVMDVLLYYIKNGLSEVVKDDARKLLDKMIKEIVAEYGDNVDIQRYL